MTQTTTSCNPCVHYAQSRLEPIPSPSRDWSSTVYTRIPRCARARSSSSSVMDTSRARHSTQRTFTRHVRDLHHVHVRQGDRQGAHSFAFDCSCARARDGRRGRGWIFRPLARSGSRGSIAIACGRAARGRDAVRAIAAAARDAASFYVAFARVRRTRRRRRARASHRPLRKPLSRMNAMNECVNARLGRGLTRCDVRYATLGAIPRSRVEELPSSRAGVLRRAFLRQRRRGTSLARAHPRHARGVAGRSIAISIGDRRDRSIVVIDRRS